MQLWPLRLSVISAYWYVILSVGYFILVIFISRSCRGSLTHSGLELFKIVYELLYLQPVKNSAIDKNHIFQSVRKIFCVEFQKSWQTRCHEMAGIHWRKVDNPLGTVHYNDVIMGAIASQITSLTIVYSTVYSDTDQRKKTKLRVTGLCAGNSPETGEFPA